MLRLSIRVPDQVERIFESEDPRITIGRGSSNLLVIENPHISTHHARIDILKSEAKLTDLGSTNGSMIQRDAHRIAVTAGGTAERIEVGDTIVLGDSSAPVTIIVLDDATDGDAQQLAEPPRTDIAVAPVDPNSGGVTKLRRPVSAFSQLTPILDGRPQLAQGIMDLSRALVSPTLSGVFDAVAAAVFAQCPAVSHLFIRLQSGSDAAQAEDYRRIRGRDEIAEEWLPSRVLVAKTGIAQEAWLVAHSRLEVVEAGAAPRIVPSAICVPLLHQGQPRGVLYVDNRDTSEPLEEEDLALVAAIGCILNLSVDLRAHRTA